MALDKTAYLEETSFPKTSCVMYVQHEDGRVNISACFLAPSLPRGTRFTNRPLLVPLGCLWVNLFDMLHREKYAPAYSSNLIWGVVGDFKEHLCMLIVVAVRDIILAWF